PQPTASRKDPELHVRSSEGEGDAEVSRIPEWVRDEVHVPRGRSARRTDRDPPEVELRQGRRETRLGGFAERCLLASPHQREITTRLLEPWRRRSRSLLHN